MVERISVRHAFGCNQHAFYYIVEDPETFDKDGPLYELSKIDIHPGATRPKTLATVRCESCGQPFIPAADAPDESRRLSRRDLFRLGSRR